MKESGRGRECDPEIKGGKYTKRCRVSAIKKVQERSEGNHHGMPPQLACNNSAA